MRHDHRTTKLMLTGAIALVGALAGFAGHAARADDAPGSEAWGDETVVKADPSDDRVIGRVVGVRGRVFAQTPGEPKRLLVENAPIFPGDRIVTSKGTQLGVLSGDYYTALGENSTLVYSKRGPAAPDVRLERGDVRVVNAGDGANARIETPGMVAAAAGPDTSAYAVQEKAWVVSLVCAREGQVKVAAGSQSLTVGEGGCAASQPVAGLFAAGAPPIAVPPPVAAGPLGGAAAGALASAAAPPPVGNAGPRFADPVADGPPGSGSLIASARPGIQGADAGVDIVQPCDAPGTCTFFGAAPPPVVPPINGWVGGNLPGLP